MARNLLISESHIGYHLAPEILDADILAFTFYPIIRDISVPIESIESVYPRISFNKITFNGNSIEKEIAYYNGTVADYIAQKMQKYDTLFIGFDLDIMGQLMASILFYMLLNRGIEENKILRLPLTDEGYITEDEYYYIGFGDFLGYKDMIAQLEAIRMEQRLIWKERVGYGFRKMEILRELTNLNTKEIPRLNKKTNTFTYAVKMMMGEK